MPAGTQREAIALPKATSTKVRRQVSEKILKGIYLKMRKEDGLVFRGQCTAVGHAKLRPYFSRLSVNRETIVRRAAFRLTAMPFERRFILLITMKHLEGEGVIPYGTKSRCVLALLGAVTILQDSRMAHFFTIKDGIVHLNTDLIEMNGH